MSQQQKIGKTATKIYKNGSYTAIRYHQTDVVRFNNVEIVLNNGGWYSATTKVRMNQASNQYDLGFQVYQEKRLWYVKYREEVLPFANGMKLDRY